MDRTDAGAVPGWPQAVFNMLIMLYTVFLGWKPRKTESRLKVLLPFVSITWWLIGFARWSRDTSTSGIQNTSNWALVSATALLQLLVCKTGFGQRVSLITLVFAGVAGLFTIAVSCFQVLGSSSNVGYVSSPVGAYGPSCTFSDGLHELSPPLQGIAVSRWRFFEAWCMIVAAFLTTNVVSASQLIQ
jgi:hypothetical protein